MTDDRWTRFRCVYRVAWDGSGSVLAAGDCYGAVALYELSSGAFAARGVRRVASGRCCPVTALCSLAAAAPDVFAVGTAGGALALLAADDTQARAQASTDSVAALCAAESGASVVVAHGPPRPCLSVRDSATLGERWRTSSTQTHAGHAVNGVCAARRDRSVVVSCGGDGSARLWDVRAPGTEPAAVLGLPPSVKAGELCCVAASADGALLACGSESGEAFVWHAHTGTLLARTGDPGSGARPLADVVLAQDGTLLCAPSGAAHMAAFALHDTKAATTAATGSEGELAHVGVMSEAYRTAALDAPAGIVAVCERAPPEPQQHEQHQNEHRAVVLPQRPLRAAACTDGTVRVFDERVCVAALRWPV